jgi:hypothetical protein
MILVLVAPVVFFTPFAEISQPVQVIGQQVAVTARQSIITHHALQGRNDIVEFLFIIAAGRELGLKLIEFLQSASESELVAAAGERHRLNILDVLPHPLKKLPTPVLASKPLVAIPVEGIRIAPNRLIAGTSLIASVPVGPEKIKGISFGAALWILDTDYRNTTVSWILNQLLAASAVNTGKAEVDRIRRQGSTALESPPLRRLAGKIAEIRSIPANLNLGCAIHDDFDCAFSPICTDAAQRGRPPRKGLSTS